jgi:hypothetical protein
MPVINIKGEDMARIDLDQVVDYINSTGPNTRIYLGADSVRFKIRREWWAEYTVAVVVHIDGCRGCRIFGDITRERDFDQRADRPSMRLMNEVYRVSEMYLALAPRILDRDIQVHLDINPSELAGSSCVISQAIGYIRGVCNVVPFVKPQAFAASYAADRIGRYGTTG